MIKFKEGKLIINNEKFLAFIFCIYFNATIIVDIFRLLGQSYIPSISAYTDIFRNIIYSLVIIGILITFKPWRIKKELVIVNVVFLLLLGISLINNNNICGMLFPFLTFFTLRCLPGFYLTLHIKNYKSVLKYMEKYKYIIFIYTLLIIKIYSNLNVSYSQSNYMAVSYNLLQVAMVILACAICYKKRYYYILHIYIIVVMLIYGARGSLVCLFVFYIFIFLLTREKKLSIKKIMFSFLFIIILALTIINMENILQKMGNEFTFSRNLSLINADSLFDFANRVPQYSVFAKEILQNPFKFRGILTDRLLMGKIFSYEPTYNVYPHNLILEVLYQLGVILFSIFTIIIIYYFIKKLSDLKNRGKIEKCFFAILVPIPFINLMFSGSYLISYTFWMGLGYLLRKEKC